MGFSDAKIAPSPPYTPPGTILMREGFVPQFSTVVPHLRTVPPLAARCSVSSHRPRLRRAVFRRCGRPLGVSSRLQPLRGLRLRTALRSVCSPLQPFGPSDARKLACGSPMFPQFAIVALLRYRLQASCLFRPHWTSASPVPRTARGEAPSHRVRASCAPLALSWGF